MAEVTTRSLKNERTILRDVVPVDTPFLLGIFLGDICNFKCKYCIQSADESLGRRREDVKRGCPHSWGRFETDRQLS